MRRLLYISIVTMITITLVACGDSSTSPDTNGDDDNGNSEPATYTVSVDVDPSDAGSISDLADSYKEGDEVEVEATPNEEYLFAEWTGDVENEENPLSLTVDQDYSLTANFEKKTYSLSTNTEGDGAIDENVVQEKSTDYESGTVVELTANPGEGYKFVEWKGDLSGTENPQQITVDNPKEVTAVFEKKSYALTINTTGSGSVTKVPDQSAYEHGTSVDLKAVPANGYEFVEWTGAITGTDNPVDITVDEEKEVTAVFEEKQVKFYVAENGVTIKCEEANVGEAGTVDGGTYTKRSADQITPDNAPTSCTSGITDMSGLFEDANAFNGDISHWDVSSVTDMSNMFYNAGVFEGSISHWNVSGVEDMGYMFSGADNFNGDLSSWDVSNVTNMKGMFSRATPFNGDLSSWDVSAVTDMTAMFSNTSFNQNLNDWDVSEVTSMASMFRNVASFNQDLNNWEVSKVVDMGGMFRGADNFNGDISSWDVSNVEDMSRMFYEALVFDQDLDSWDVSSVTNMAGMFRDAESFNGNVSNWDVSSVSDMGHMFDGAVNFNSDIGSWDVTGITSATKMSRMLHFATSFNHDLSSWCVAEVGYEPYAFAAGSKLSDGQLPNWGDPCGS